MPSTQSDSSSPTTLFVGNDGARYLVCSDNDDDDDPENESWVAELGVCSPDDDDDDELVFAAVRSRLAGRGLLIAGGLLRSPNDRVASRTAAEFCSGPI
jgi:hypothetical protein